MITLKPLKRKPDLLDELDFLRYRRRMAYEKGDRDVVTLINLDIKAFRISNDWDEEDAEAEFLENEKEASVPFAAFKGNNRIRYDLFDEDHVPKGLRLTIHELSIYSARRDFGLAHYEALLAVG
jgi:hypothetical protein